MKKRLPVIVVAIFLIALLIWAFSPQPLDVETARIQVGRFERSVEDDGWTRVRDRYVISAPLSGHLARIPLREGDAVTRGDPTAFIRPAAPPLLDERAALEQRERVALLDAEAQAAQISIERAQVALQQARIDLSRHENFTSAISLLALRWMQRGWPCNFARMNCAAQKKPHVRPGMRWARHASRCATCAGQSPPQTEGGQCALPYQDGC